MLNWLSQLVGPAVDLIKQHRELAAEKRQQKVELERAKHEARLKNIRADRQAEVDWNQRAQAGAGWKDEFLTLLLSVPMILAFFPGAVPYVMEGFAALEEMPNWYKSAVGLMIASAFGYRKFIDHKMRKAFTLPEIKMDKGG